MKYAFFLNLVVFLSVSESCKRQGTYRIRFSPDRTGTWTYLTSSNEKALDNKSGSFECLPPGVENHGPLQVLNTHYLAYADGTPSYSVGTTAYQWTSVKQSIQEKTIETLASAPFNKIRMYVFPKSYRYGNDTETCPIMISFRISTSESASYWKWVFRQM